MKRRYSLKLVMENYLSEDDNKFLVKRKFADNQKSDGREQIKVRGSSKNIKSKEEFQYAEDSGTIKDPDNGKMFDYSHNYDEEVGSTKMAGGDWVVGQAGKIKTTSKILPNQSQKIAWYTGGPLGFVRTEKVRGSIEATYCIVIPGKKDKFPKSYKEWSEALKKHVGISEEGLRKIINDISKDSVQGEKELDNLTKDNNTNESLSRGSLYRRRYRRY